MVRTIDGGSIVTNSFCGSAAGGKSVVVDLWWKQIIRSVYYNKGSVKAVLLVPPCHVFQSDRLNNQFVILRIRVSGENFHHR